MTEPSTESSKLTSKQLITSGAICLLLAIIVIVLFVMPAEMEQDPSGFGEIAGLDKLAATSDETAKLAAPVSVPGTEGHYVFIDPATTDVPYDNWDRPLPALNGNNHQSQDGGFKTETITVNLGLDGTTEYKALMNQGDALVYSWTADQDIYADFHAHQAVDNPDFFTRYSETEGTSDQGSIVAPYDGQHGWFWLNLADGPAVIELTVAGYYDEIIEINLEAEAGY